MRPEQLCEDDRLSLLQLARQAIQHVLQGEELPELELTALSPALQNPGATFVTLTLNGQLRGCIGALEARMALAEDVRAHAVAAALQDYRFQPVTLDELNHLKIEISYLTPSKPVEYQDPQELLEKLIPFVDGVVLRDGERRATFLPQVWEKVSDIEHFLGFLCQKMGYPPDMWRCRPLQVATYQVEKFSE
jgi:uncharacterized protein